MGVAFHWFPKIKIFSIITKCMITIAILTMTFTLNGDWLIITIHLFKQFGILQQVDVDRNTLQQKLISDFRRFWISSMLTAYGMYFFFGLLYHWYYYVSQKNCPELWKCQPNRWLSRELEIDEIKISCVSLLVANTWSALISCYIYNGGYSWMYYNWNEYGIVWAILQFAVIFLYQDYALYWFHRIYHHPFLYHRFHKIHHKYKTPTAFSVAAIHPIEIVITQVAVIMPIFIFPIHWVPFSIVSMYGFHWSIKSHSGINFKASWWQPWQADAIFHDNHHQYFHVNFGLNCTWWDKMHNTYRQPDRIYNEEIFYGKGKTIAETSKEELENDIRERRIEQKTKFRDYNYHLVRSLKMK